MSICSGNSLAVQWLGLGAFTAEGPGSIPGQGTKILQATWHSKKTKQTNKQNTKTPKKIGPQGQISSHTIAPTSRTQA